MAFVEGILPLDLLFCGSDIMKVRLYRHNAVVLTRLEAREGSGHRPGRLQDGVADPEF